MNKSSILIVLLFFSCTIKEEGLTQVNRTNKFPQSNTSVKAIRERVL